MDELLKYQANRRKSLAMHVITKLIYNKILLHFYLQFHLNTMQKYLVSSSLS